MNIRQVTEALVAELQALTDRPVTPDPRNLAPLPAVIVQPPSSDANDLQTLCGEPTWSFDVYAVHTTGAWAELQPLLDLVEQLSEHPDVTFFELVTYVPYGDRTEMPPGNAYRFRIQKLM